MSISLPANREEARGRIIFALDVETAERAFELVARLDGVLSFFKIGLELWARDGERVARRVADSGGQLFLDLKFHDIPETVARATRGVADLNPRFLTLHGPPAAARAASEAVSGSSTELLGVTVLTSVSEEAYREFNGLRDDLTLADIVLRRADLLLAAGCKGVVASPHEARALRLRHPDAIIVTPGIRPAGAPRGDQSRVATPAEASAAGADYLVVGRPVRDAEDPRLAAEAIVGESWDGFARRAESAAATC